MIYAAVCFAALLAAALTFVSGFGLGTLLLPAFALFVPPEVAVAATAVVHLANNVFKLALTRSSADRTVVLRFGLVALALAVVGALLQKQLEGLEPLYTHTLTGRDGHITWLKASVGAVIVAFSIIELSPRYDSLAYDRRWLPLGGALSGFFGGLSGHQGALRSAFLVRCGLSKEAFVATGVVCSVLVDVPRLAVYGKSSWTHLSGSESMVGPIAAGCAAAFLGTLLGARLVKKITLKAVRVVVGVALLLFGVAMVGGLV